MEISELKKEIVNNQLGDKMYDLMRLLYPVPRSITGNGVRKTLNILSEMNPLKIHEVPSGTKVFDWEVPPEWNIKDAWIKNNRGEKIIDFRNSNLHVLNYSIPVKKKISLKELKEHLFTLPEYPDWIPYRTSYHNSNWGFCMAHNQFNGLKKDEYEVLIDSTIKPGHLTYGEYFIQGKSNNEVLISCHICHPSLSDDNLSGIVVSTYLALLLGKLKLQYSYRFLFIPGTIGSITWLSRNEDKTDRIKHGLVLTLLGDKEKFHYKKSRRGNADIDRIVEYVLRQSGEEYGIMDYYPYGYDERQYCSPGFNLPVGRLSRAVHGTFPEYHTSADNLEFVHPDRLAGSLSLILDIIRLIESNKIYLNTNPKCEPQLGKRGLFKKIGGQSDTKDYQMALLWVLNMSDGKNSLLDISNKSKIDFDMIKTAADALFKVKLLEEKQL